MNIKEINDKNIWNNFLVQESNSSFLQSFEFGEFYSSLNKKIWRLGLYENEKLVGICLLVKQTAKFGNFLYSPGGPVLAKLEYFDPLVEKARGLAIGEKVSFVRFDPRVESDEFNIEAKKLGLVETANFTQPQCSLRLDLNISEEELRSGLSESTRYNVGWVARQGVTVKVSQDQKDFEIFQRLLKETSARQGFLVNNEAEYYQKQYQTLNEAGLAKLYIAYEPKAVGNEVLASAVVVTFNRTTTYLHAASSNKSPKLRAPYLMQWQIITDAKKAGSTNYDFWGVSAADDPKDPWAGVTAFKRSFGGEKVCYQKPVNLVVSGRYNFDKLIEKARLISRKWR